jgi:hypothetical protein
MEIKENQTRSPGLSDHKQETNDVFLILFIPASLSPSFLIKEKEG